MNSASLTTMATTGRQGLRDLTNAPELLQSPSRKRSRQQTEEEEACAILQPAKTSQITVKSKEHDQPVHLDIPKTSAVFHRRGGAQRMMRHSRQLLSLAAVTPGTIYCDHKSYLFCLHAFLKFLRVPFLNLSCRRRRTTRTLLTTSRAYLRPVPTATVCL